MKLSPRPWKHSPYGDIYAAKVDGYEDLVATVHGTADDKALIAAAPELFDAAKELLNGHSGNRRVHMDKLRAVVLSIEKAPES